MSHEINRIVASYESVIVRVYAIIRFQIMRQRFLDEIGQYLPAGGRILDVGCGFGLFAMYYASLSPARTIHGFDLNAARVEMAKQSMARLGLTNCHFSVGNAATATIDQPYDAVYMLDILHHIPVSAVEPLIARITANLSDTGVLLVKDVADRPAYKRWFTWILDKMMDYRTPVSYWSIETMRAALARHGYVVYVHQMVDYLPYPHVLYVCARKPVATA